MPRTTAVIQPDAQHVANIVNVVTAATEEERTFGMHWYRLYAASITQLATDAGLTREQGLALFAVLSQNTKIHVNWRNYRALLADRLPYAPRESVNGVQKDKLAAILADSVNPGQYARGEKIASFYANLAGAHDVVTVDRHAISACYDEMIYTVGSRYAYVQECYRMAAALLQVTPAQCQAVAWVVWRRMKGIVDDELTA